MNAALGAARLGALDADTVVGFVGQGVRRLVERCVIAGGGTADVIPEVLDGFLSHYGAHLFDRTRPYPGVPEALAALQSSGATLSVLTNKPGSLARRLVDALDFGGARFSAVLGNGDGFDAKPESAGAAHLLDLIGISRGETMLIGDSPVDVATARAVRVSSCAVLWGFCPPAKLLAAAPDFLIDQPAALLGLRSPG